MKTTLFALLLLGTTLFVYAQRPAVTVAWDMEDDALMRACGYKYFVEKVDKIISPQKVSDEQFAENVATIKKLKTNMFAVNYFLPGNLKVIGPDVNEEAILAYTDVVFQRCKKIDVDLVVWGSGGSRRLPDGWDYQKAVDQFVAIAKKVAVQAQKYDILITVENLNKTEANFLNCFDEVVNVVKRVGEPNLMACVDIYHMLMDGDPPSMIAMGKGITFHCDIAEKADRDPPGTLGDEVVPYLQELKQIDYKGSIVIEARWDDFPKEAPATLKYLEAKVKEVWK
ncbi:MAG: sugar phosphate isomerase/epimerase family protein [Imperialibacter sp.]|uniref:sugar phosphate isomerase/epimerase family protein n=1 Tax=Imperialibacter sp. TaxID=2038411 RepID=UPI0032ED7034